MRKSEKMYKKSMLSLDKKSKLRQADKKTDCKQYESFLNEV